MPTIAAISTGNTVSAIGVLRLSGEEAFSIADQVFRPLNGKKLSDHPRRMMVLGMLLNREGEAIDQCLAVTFAAGGSYTGEDSVEFHCHGSPVVLNEGLRALFAHGAVQAGRGEFTKRAFLSGNLDLTQAEAVIDLIEAESAEAARNAVEQLGGSLRRKIESVYDSLLNISSQFYAVVDYPDEDIEDLGREEIERTLADSEKTLRDLLATFKRGQVMRQGVPTAIVGRPNVGKSSLLNALLGYDRAIVTDVAGTTRDTIEEKAVVGGVLLRLIDTAGIRETEDTVERIGVERSRNALENAQLVLAVVDSSDELTDEDIAILSEAAKCEKCILVWSKSDLSDGSSAMMLKEMPVAQVSVSSLTGEGLDTLERAVAKLFPQGEVPAGLTLTNTRQAEAVERAVRSIGGALEALCGGLTPDAVLTDAEGALNALGELTGRTLREDLVGRIFERFCVGK
ncbi:MAG: tRNA uridine-5-carboxymethylaminomethyl(34) synthesis GTPase MnmE [Oscillospiraceae bacterium]|nr:tRNA uridine-5-carboxymethylaminomethyl(34) synthesis GTPase MnmE [Oscillospiraceae bacterium]